MSQGTQGVLEYLKELELEYLKELELLKYQHISYFFQRAIESFRHTCFSMSISFASDDTQTWNGLHI